MLLHNLDRIVRNVKDADIIFIVDGDSEIENDYIIPINDSQKFVNILRENAKTNKKIYMIIHCNGGCVIESDVIINSMLRHNNPIYAYIPNYASSAATLIAFAADKIYMDTYAFVTPTDPQITLENGETYSSRVLSNFLKSELPSKDSNFALAALDAKIYHKDNIETIKKIMNKRNISKKKLKNVIKTFGKGKLPHHYPIYSNELNNYGIKVTMHIPNEITELFEKFISL